jgi:hypothetical protein
MKTPAEIIAEIVPKEAARIVEVLETAGYHVIRKDAGNEPFEFGRRYEAARIPSPRS